MLRALTLLMVAAVVVALPPAALARQTADPAPGMATGSSESHLFIGATARSLPAGHGYYSLREFGFGAFQVGVTDRFSFGAGTIVFYPKFVALTPKYQFYRSATASAAVGVVHATQFGREGFGVAYGVATQEFKSGSMSAGLGLIYASSADTSGATAVAMIGGERRISPRVDFLTENYVFVAGAALTSVGVRVRRGRFTSEVGALVTLIPGAAAGGPIINFGYKF